jgi:hypothetical protein
MNKMSILRDGSTEQILQNGFGEWNRQSKLVYAIHPFKFYNFINKNINLKFFKPQECEKRKLYHRFCSCTDREMKS